MPLNSEFSNQTLENIEKEIEPVKEMDQKFRKLRQNLPKNLAKIESTCS